jgi:hypothetical protein
MIQHVDDTNVFRAVRAASSIIQTSPSKTALEASCHGLFNGATHVIVKSLVGL